MLDDFNPLGAIEDMNPQAWANYVSGLRTSLQQAWVRAETQRSTLKKVREVLGLPFIVDSPTEAGAPGAWNSTFEQQTLETKGVVLLLTKFADELAVGERGLALDQASGEFVILGKESDSLFVRVINGRPTLVYANTGQPVPPNEITGTLDGLLGAAPIPPIVIAIGAVSLVATGIVAYAITTKVCETVASTARQKTIETISTAGKKLVQEGKATPEQVATMDKALFEGQAAVTQAEATKAEEESQWPRTVRTVALVGLGIAGVWLVGNMFARRGGASAPAPALSAPAALASNPSGKVSLRRVYLDRGGYDSGGRYFGVGEPLYVAESDEYDWREYVRARSREEAKEKVREAARRSSRWPSGVAPQFYRAA